MNKLKVKSERIFVETFSFTPSTFQFLPRPQQGIQGLYTAVWRFINSLEQDIVGTVNFEGPVLRDEQAFRSNKIRPCRAENINEQRLRKKTGARWLTNKQIDSGKNNRRSRTEINENYTAITIGTAGIHNGTIKGRAGQKLWPVLLKIYLSPSSHSPPLLKKIFPSKHWPILLDT